LYEIIVCYQLDTGGRILPTQFALPIRVARDRACYWTHPFVVRHQQTAAPRTYPQHREKTSAHPKPIEVPHLASMADISLIQAPGKHPGKCLLFLTNFPPQRLRQFSILLIEAHAAV